MGKITNEKVLKIMNNMEKTMIGKPEVLRLSILSLLAEGHLLLEDVPGVGKTTLAKTLAKTLGCGFSRIQFTPDTLPSDVLGVTVYHMEKGEFEFMQGAVMSNIILADEINRTSPKTQSSLLEAMEERQVTVDGKTHILPKPFMVIATQNPIDYLGTYHLPEAQLDRFFMKLSIGYPSVEQEILLAKSFLERKDWKHVEAVTDETEIRNMQKEVSQILIHDDIVSYLLSLVDKTRNNEYITLGVSPRATLAMLRGAQASAYFENRDYIIPNDIVELLEPVLLHRLVLSTEARMNQMNASKVMASLRHSVKVPIL